MFDVADLIIGIPSSVNPSTLYSRIQFQGAFLTIFGSSFVPQFGIRAGSASAAARFGGGGFGGGGFPGGGGGQFQGGGVGIGGALGGGGRRSAVLGGGGAMGSRVARGRRRGRVRRGARAASAGQFGIQGNDQSQFLVQLIIAVVARGEWDLQFVGGAQQPLFSPEDVGPVPAARRAAGPELDRVLPAGPGAGDPRQPPVPPGAVVQAAAVRPGGRRRPRPAARRQVRPGQPAGQPAGGAAGGAVPAASPGQRRAT